MAGEHALDEVLRGHGIETDGLLALRVDLHPADATDEFRSVADLMRADQLANYMRMQDGRRLGADNLVLCFVADAEGTSRLFDLRRFRARRPGIAPGDLVYDPDIVDLLHNFIGRARRPTFYDLFEPDDWIERNRFEAGSFLGSLRVRWPEPRRRTVWKVSNRNLHVVVNSTQS